MSCCNNSLLQRVAACCSVLQCVVVLRDVLLQQLQAPRIQCVCCTSYNTTHSHIGFLVLQHTLQHTPYDSDSAQPDMGWLQLVGSIKLSVSFAKEPYKRDDILQKRPRIVSILLTVATPYLTTRSNHLSFRKVLRAV